MARAKSKQSEEKHRVDGIRVGRPRKRKTRRFVNNTEPVKYSFRHKRKQINAVNTEKNKSAQVPVVYLTRCAVTDDLLKKLYQSGDNMVSYGAEDNISGNNRDLKVTKPRSKQVSGASATKFVRSFKITAQLNNTTNTARKIDIISLPVETVSTTDGRLKESKRISVSKEAVTEKVLEDIVNITSSDSIFTNATLDSDGAVAIITSPTKLSVCRSISNTSLHTIASASHPWRNSIQTKDFTTKRSTESVTDLDCHVTKRSAEPHINLGCLPARRTLIRSDSSGYHSEHKLSDSPVSSNVSSPKRRTSGDYCHDITITVTSNQVSTPMQNEYNPGCVAVAKKRLCEFKTPKLPLYRRPPTRIQGCSSVNSNVETNSVKYIPQPTTNWTRKVVLDDADAISLYAESSCFDQLKEDLSSNTRNTFQASKDEEQNILDTNISNKRVISPPPPVQHVQQKPTISICSKKSEAPMPVVNKLIPLLNERNLQAQKAMVPLSPNQFNNMGVDTSKVNDWIASTVATKSQGNARNVFMWLKKMCRFYFGNRNCQYYICRFSHNLPNDFQNTLRELNEEKFKMVLNEIVKFKHLFKDTFEMILMYFKEKDLADDLIYLIQDILNMPFDKTPFVRQVIFTLKDMGFSFVEAIDEILLTHGRKTESLLDILLSVIVEEDDCLENNWHFIDKLTKFRKDKLDYGVVCEIFQKCCNKDEPNKQFCENIYKDLIVKSHIELDNIDRNLVIKYVNLLYHFNFIQYAEHLKQNTCIRDHELAAERIHLVPEVNPKTTTNEQQPDDKNSSSGPCSVSTSNSSAEYQEDVSRHGATDEGNKISATSSSQSSEIDYEPLSNSDCVDTGNIQEDEDYGHNEEQEEAVEDGRSEVHDEVKEHEERGQELIETDAVQSSSQLFQTDFSLQPNESYTNCDDLDTYLNYVNRETYTTANVFRTEEPLPVVNNENCANKKDLSPTSDYSKSCPSTSGSNRVYSNSDETKNDSFVELELLDQDILKLVDAVNKSSLSDLFSIMKKAVDHKMSRSFVVHAVTALRALPTQKISKFILNIFENLGNMSNKNLMPHLVNHLSSMKNIMTLLAFNILPVLDQKKEYAVAVRVINIFSKEMGAFIETKCFGNNEWLCTTQLRYVFIFKILSRAHKLREALKLLKSSHLGVDAFSADSVDSRFSHKRRLLNEFINITLQKDLQVSKETILYLMLNMDALQNSINLVKFWNQLVVNLLNSYSTYQSELLGLIDNISNGWYKYLTHSTMRAILVRGFNDLPERKLMDFFNLCVEIGIYKIHEGYENSIGIPRNLLSEEILFILHVHFHKICKSNFPLTSIVITLVDPIEMDEYTPLLSIFTNSIANDREMITRIVNMFPKFDHFPTADKLNISHGVITIFYECIQYFLKPYRTSLPSITKFR